MKGNLLVAQSGGPTPVINSSLVGVMEESLEHSIIGGIWGAREGITGVLEQDFVDLRPLAAEQREVFRRTPAAALGSCRHKLTGQTASEIVEICRQRDIRYFLYIGGNDSADTSHRVHQAAVAAGYELNVVGVPKTIDNDLPVTDHTPGYGSVARFIAIATLGAGRDTEAMRRSDPVKIVEVMGRNAGWLAAASALGKKSKKDAPHLIYLPELPLRESQFLKDVEQVYREIGFCVVVVSEHIRSEQGEPIGSRGPNFVDPFGHIYHESPANYLAQLVQERLGIRGRYDRPGSIQRMIGPLVSRIDEAEAYMVGRHAVRSAVAGLSDKMVILDRHEGASYGCSAGLAELLQIANKEKLMPVEFISEAGNFVTEAFFRYAMPLIGDPLPEYARFE